MPAPEAAPTRSCPATVRLPCLGLCRPGAGTPAVGCGLLGKIMAASPPTSDTFARVEKLMRRDLKLGSDIEINPTTPFFGSNADIDSLDILLLLRSIDAELGLRIHSEPAGRAACQNVGTLVPNVDEHCA